MNQYTVQTGWLERTDNLGKVRRYPQHEGNIDILAINKEVAAMTVLVNYIDLSETVKEISAKGDRNLPKIPTNLLCGSKLLIAN